MATSVSEFVGPAMLASPELIGFNVRPPFHPQRLLNMFCNVHLPEKEMVSLRLQKSLTFVVLLEKKVND